MRFRTSQLYVSAIPPFVIGALVGVLALELVLEPAELFSLTMR